MQRNLSREAHLWYTITSSDYVAQANDRLLAVLNRLRADVVRQPLMVDHPPVTHWGNVMEDLIASFGSANQILKSGEFEPMQRWAGRLMDIPRSFRESNLGWLTADEQDAFLRPLDEAYGIASKFNRALTMSEMYSADEFKNGSADWHADIPKDMGIVSNNILRNQEDSIYAVVGRPDEIPQYVADTSVACRSGDIVPWTGVWVPSTGMATAALAFARQYRQIMQPAYELARVFADGETVKATQLIDTTWHPVKPNGRMTPLPAPKGMTAAAATDTAPAGGVGRCEAGRPCHWFTPAKPDSRRRFEHGETMPALGGDYGLTIWQWAPDQAN